MAYMRSFFTSIALVMTFVSHCWAVNVPSDEYATIQAAITALKDNPALGDTIDVARGVYRENLVLTGAITIVGKETAATFLEAENENEAILSISDTSNVTVRNFTFRNGNQGIVLTSSSDVTIASNIFRLGSDGNAISSDESTGANIINNTFYDNNTAVDGGSEATEVTNNIFDNNALAISPDTPMEMVRNNCFSNNSDAVINDNPLFVNSSLGDFHLRKDSPCIDVGDGMDTIDNTTADIGAYGGSYADVFPFKVQGVVVSDISAGNGGIPTILVSWLANESYLVTNATNPGGYKLHYDSDEPGPDYKGTNASASTLVSPADAKNVTSYIISNFTRLSVDREAPTNINITLSDQTLGISWGTVESATGYRLYYGENDPLENYIDVGVVTNYSLRGLTNGVTYNIAVSALYPATYYLSVTAYDNTKNPDHESDYSDERSFVIEDGSEGNLSASEPGIPEAVVPFPLLPDEGCFIATAAFGYYDAPQVQLLRSFRDHYLLSHFPGEWFVKQYYTHGPGAARYIEQHPEWKPVVRMLLLPLIAMAWVLFKAFWLVQAMVVVSGGVMLGALYLRRKKRKSALVNHAREILS